MADSLPAYLHDHLSGSRFAIHLLESMRDEHAGTPLSEFAAQMLTEVEEDRNLLQSIADRAGDSAPVLKEAASWIGEKMSRLKLTPTAAGEFGTFESLEVLSVGILGKRALWKTLGIVAGFDPRVRGFDYDALLKRAEDQYGRVEQRRVEMAHTAFSN